MFFLRSLLVKLWRVATEHRLSMFKSRPRVLVSLSWKATHDRIREHEFYHISSGFELFCVQIYLKEFINSIKQCRRNQNLDKHKEILYFLIITTREDRMEILCNSSPVESLVYHRCILHYRTFIPRVP